MKRIIYSIWDELTEKHTSANSYKQEQFEIYLDQLKAKHKMYADLCHADYHVFSIGPSRYQDIQFAKLYELEKLSEEYDEILYLDMDVIPNTNKIIFNEFDLSKISLHIRPPPWIPKGKELNKIFENSNYHFSYMNSWLKMVIKKSMLLVDDIVGENTIANTGVICVNSDAIKKIELSEKLNEADRAYNLAFKDNFHPKRVTDAWTKNNEVFISYIIEKYNIDYNELGLRWNYILDSKISTYSPVGYFIHQVNKDFEATLDEVQKYQSLE